MPQIARRRFSRNVRDGLIETTALVNECYLKFVQRESLTPADRAQVLAHSATVMRSRRATLPGRRDALLRGMENDEIAKVMGVSKRTAHRDRGKARLLLSHALRGR